VINSETDLTRSFQSLIPKSNPFNFDTSKKRLENRTTEFLLNFPEDYNKKLASEISKVRFENIKPALQNVFHPENLALTIVGDANVLQKPLSKTKLFNKIQRKDFMND
jgi:predicted Zn-dependent peptidase